MSSFWSELKRRNVIKASIAYLVVNWVLLQILSILLPIAGSPSWVMKTLTLLMVIGFPVWVIISWVYEVTPEGLKKTANVPEDLSVTVKTNKRLNILIIIGLIAAISVSFFNRSAPNNSSSNNSKITTKKTIEDRPSKELNSGVKYFNIVLPEDKPISFINKSQGIAGQTAFDISPDGSKIVYVTEKNGRSSLVLRYINSKEIKSLSGTEGAFSPFFSPDGLWVGFFTRDIASGGMLKKVSINTNVSVELCSTSHPFGGDWNNKGTIIFSDAQGTKIRLVSENGGKAEVLNLSIDGTEFRNWAKFPKYLPDDDHIILSGNPITVFSIKTEKGKKLTESGTNVRYMKSGHLLFIRGSKLMATSFDLENSKILGTPFPMFQGIRVESAVNTGQFTVSDTGDLIFVENKISNLTKFMWVNRDGKSIDTLDLPPASYGSFSLSPSGDLLAFSLSGKSFIYDLMNKRKIKITGAENIYTPFFSPDSRSVGFSGSDKISYYLIDSDEKHDIINFDGELNHWSGVLNDWSLDGRYLGFHSNEDLFVYTFENDTIIPVVQTDNFESQMDFSPDSRFFCYMSDETGVLEVYVRPFPINEKKWKISFGFGIDPVWSFDGQEIFYRTNNQMYSVKVNTDSDFTHEEPELLFEGDFFVDVGMKSFAVSPDRKKILILNPLSIDNTSRELTIITNWFDELKNKIPLDK